MIRAGVAISSSPRPSKHIGEHSAINEWAPRSTTIPRRLLYHDGAPLHFLKRLADTFHRQLDFVRWTNVNEENMILPTFHQFAQSGLQFGTSTTRETALENRKLQPLAESMHRFEDAAPAALVCDVIGDNEKTFLVHARASSRQILWIAWQ